MSKSFKSMLTVALAVVPFMLLLLRRVVHFREEVNDVFSFFSWIGKAFVDPLSLMCLPFVVIAVIVWRKELADWFREIGWLSQRENAASSKNGNTVPQLEIQYDEETHVSSDHYWDFNVRIAIKNTSTTKRVKQLRPIIKSVVCKTPKKRSEAKVGVLLGRRLKIEGHEVGASLHPGGSVFVLLLVGNRNEHYEVLAYHDDGEMTGYYLPRAHYEIAVEVSANEAIADEKTFRISPTKNGGISFRMIN